MEIATMEKTTELEAAVMDQIKDRRSSRSYLSKPLEAEKIKSLFEAARWAPSAMNDQPWTYVFATKGEGELWVKLYSMLNDGNRLWAGNAPLLILSMARNTYRNYGTPNPTALYDLGAANAFLSLQATELGLNAHQMGGYNREKTRELLNIPDTYDLGVIIAVGYPGGPELLPEALRERELSPRYRFSQKEFVHSKAFEK